MNDPLTPLLEASALTKSYDGGLVRALDGVSLTLKAGRLYVLSGPSGCGKSTLLHLLGGLDTPDSGTVRFRGVVLKSLTPLSRFRREHIGFVFQFHHLLPLLSLRENVEAALLFCRKIPSAQRRHEAEAILHSVGLGERMDQYANRVSGGERQRAAIARALVSRPELILADEPTGNVDSNTAKVIMAILQQRIREEGSTALVATHDPLVRSFADTVFHMEDGQIIGGEDVH